MNRIDKGKAHEQPETSAPEIAKPSNIGGERKETENTRPTASAGVGASKPDFVPPRPGPNVQKPVSSVPCNSKKQKGVSPQQPYNHAGLMPCIPPMFYWLQPPDLILDMSQYFYVHLICVCFYVLASFIKGHSQGRAILTLVKTLLHQSGRRDLTVKATHTMRETHLLP